MLRTVMIAAAAALTLSAAAFADQGGTAQEARAMLDKAVAAVKADKTKALDEVQKMLKSYEGQIDQLAASKTKEIMEQ